MQENYEIFKDLIQTVGLLFVLEIFFKKNSENEKKKSSENDQSSGHFQSFFSLFFHPPTLNLKFFPVNQLKKNSGLTPIQLRIRE